MRRRKDCCWRSPRWPSASYWPSPTRRGAAGGRARDRRSATEECIEILETGGRSTTARKHRTRCCPRRTRSSGAPSASRWSSSSSGSTGCRRCKQAMDDRTERIRGDLQAAEDQRSEADSLLTDYRAQLNDAKAEAGRIIEEARQAADQIKRDQEARLQSELAELRTRAIADIDAAKGQAMDDLRSEVAAPGDRRRRDRRAAQPRSGHPDPARRGLHQPGGRAALVALAHHRSSGASAPKDDGWQTTAQLPTPKRSSAWPAPRAPSARSRTSCSASRRPCRDPTSCATP